MKGSGLDQFLDSLLALASWCAIRGEIRKMGGMFFG